jgi:nucleotide-binding universal stress UspA family protein
LGSDIAQRAATSCQLTHATRDVLSAFALAELPERAEEFAVAQIAHAREQLLHGMWGVVPTALLERILIRTGRPAVILNDVARELGAELLVLGGKHHSTVGRWLAGSTAVDVVRTTGVPLLVTGGGRAPIRRILAAVDVSPAAQPTIAAAERFAALFGAQLRVITVLEPLPDVPGAPTYHTAEYYNMLEEHVTQHVWPLVKAHEAERFVRYGMPIDLIRQEAAAWNADLVVVGSHGKGLVDRLLLGSVTERLLNQLPTSVLVVPAYAHATARDPVLAGAPSPEQPWPKPVHRAIVGDERSGNPRNAQHTEDIPQWTLHRRVPSRTSTPTILPTATGADG